MSDNENAQCAVWYWREGTPRYQLCASEQEAAEYAVNLLDWEDGLPEYVQFADGRILAAKDWPAYDAEQYRREQETRSYLERKRDNPPRPTRTVLSPDGQKVVIPADAPSWLGRPT